MPPSRQRRTLRDSLVLLLLAVFPALLSAWLHPARPSLTLTRPAVAEISPNEVSRLTKPVLWVDARSARAYEQAHIPDAILCNEDAWEQHLPALLEAWQPGTAIVVYCDSASCAASQAVAVRLQREFSLPDTVYVLQGGWAAWQQSQR